MKWAKIYSKKFNTYIKIRKYNLIEKIAQYSCFDETGKHHYDAKINFSDIKEWELENIDYFPWEKKKG